MSPRPRGSYYPRRGPKRQIRKEVDFLPSTTVTNSLGEYTLFSAALDGETLVRIVGELAIRGIISSATLVNWAIVLSRDAYEPMTDITNVSLDGNDAEVVLAVGTATVIDDDTNGLYATYHSKIDVKGQRKLRKGDAITLIYEADQANGAALQAALVSFLKQP